MIKSTTIYIKGANKTKQELLGVFCSEYRNAVAFYVKMYFSNKFPNISSFSDAACIADAGRHTLTQIKTGTKWTAWFNALKIDPSLYNKSKYLNQWKKEDLCFGSVKELYNSVLNLLGSNESMYSSYHAFCGTYAQRRRPYKSEKSSVERIYIL